jgi:hypothetical protein
VYLLSYTELEEPVERKHSEFLWLYQQLRRDFPGLRLPDPPENTLKSVTDFMGGVLRNDLLAGSHLTNRFCTTRDEVQEKELVKRREAMYPGPDGMEKLKAFLSESVTVSPKEVEMLFNKASKTPDVVRSMTAEYDRFAESLLETMTSLSVFMLSIKKALQEIEASLEGVAAKFRDAAASTNSIITILKKLNFAKTQFPQFDDCQINLDILFLKLKAGLESAGDITRESGRSPQSSGPGTPFRADDGATQKRHIFFKNSAKNFLRQGLDGWLTRGGVLRRIKSIFSIFC